MSKKDDIELEIQETAAEEPAVEKDEEQMLLEEAASRRCRASW